MLSPRSAAPETPSWGEFWPETPIRIAIDPNGNLTQKTENGEVWDYVWNAENQLVRVCKDLTPPQTCDSDGVAVASFKYDPLMRRIERAAAATTTNYIYDSFDTIKEITNGTATLFIRGVGMDELLAVEGPGGQSFSHADGLGSVVAMTSVVGAVTSTYEYGPWGTPSVGSGQLANGYTGRSWDGAIGLHYYRARYYDSSMGRFISEDPIGFEGGLNLYAYVENNPVNYHDPTGLLPETKNWPFPSPLNCLRCVYYQWKCATEGQKCRQELDAKYPDPADLCLAYGANSPSDVYFKVCFLGTPACKEMITYCGKCALWPPAARPTFKTPSAPGPRTPKRIPDPQKPKPKSCPKCEG